MNATCHTEGCFNAGAAIDVGEVPADAQVFCGVCGNPIDDVTDQPPEQLEPAG